MRITFKLYATLTQYLPDDAKEHAVDLEISEQDTPISILQRFSVPIENVHIFLINGLFVEPDNRQKSLFKEGDVFACWPPVAGG